MPVAAVAGVDLTLERGQILGVVGESGSGKTTLGEALVNLVTPTAGAVFIAGVDVTAMSQHARALLRRRRSDDLPEPVRQPLAARCGSGQLVTEPYEIHRTPSS